VNGQRIIRGALLPGDQLAFAGEKFRVHLGPDGGPGDESTNINPVDRSAELEPLPSIASEGFEDPDDGAMPDRSLDEPNGARDSEDLVE
jgi:hypothetical protein